VRPQKGGESEKSRGWPHKKKKSTFGVPHSRCFIVADGTTEPQKLAKEHKHETNQNFTPSCAKKKKSFAGVPYPKPKSKNLKGESRTAQQEANWGSLLCRPELQKRKKPPFTGKSPNTQKSIPKPKMAKKEGKNPSHKKNEMERSPSLEREKERQKRPSRCNRGVREITSRLLRRKKCKGGNLSHRKKREEPVGTFLVGGTSKEK